MGRIMKLRTREGEFRRVGSGVDDGVGENFYKEFIDNFNALVETSGRDKITIKTAALEEDEYSWVDSSWEKKDFIADTLKKHAEAKGDAPEYAFDNFYEKAEQTDKITKENDAYYVWVGEEKIELPREKVAELMSKENEADDKEAKLKAWLDKGAEE